MGSQVIAVCQCGLNKKILIGGGRLNFRTVDFFPCLCENCQDVVEVNLKDDNPSCPNCNSQKVSPYNNKHLIGKKGKIEVARSYDNVLTNGSYKCPKCKAMTLHFTRGHMLWD